MFKLAVIIFCVLLCFTETFSTLDAIRQFFETTDQEVVRVRTPSERDRRWREFAVLDFIGLVENNRGYIAEEYNVRTIDGYVLKLHRISASPFSRKMPGKPVVYIQHGLFGSSDFFVTFDPEQSLAFLLANAGYDVWLGNLRGNTYSKQHILQSSASNNSMFWDFSLEEMATLDLPAFIDEILRITQKSNLTYIGYSMGTSLNFILLSTKPEYNSKINLAINIAPIAFFTTPHKPFVELIELLGPPTKTMAADLKVYQVLPQSKLIQLFGKDVCSFEAGGTVCGDMLAAVTNVNNLNTTVLPTFVAYTPAGASLWTLDHYYQLINTGKFQKYDFGPNGNMRMYQSNVPPEYNLAKITAPQVLFYSDDDVYIGAEGNEKLRSRLPNVVAYLKAPAGYNHLDYILSKTAKRDIYDPVLQIVAQAN